MAGRIIAIVILKEFSKKVFNLFHSLVKILESVVLKDQEVLIRKFKELLWKITELIWL